MALFKKAEWAAECNVSRAHVSVAISRGKLVETEDGKIDSENAINQAYKANCLENAAKRGQQPGHPQEPVNAKKKAKKERVITHKPDPALKKALEKKMSVELAEKEARTAKIEREMRLMEMKEMKLSGQLIPTDLVASTIRQFMQSVMISFNEGGEAFITDMTKSLKLDRIQTASLRKQMREIINVAVNRAVNNAQKNIDNIIAEHSQGKNLAA